MSTTPNHSLAQGLLIAHQLFHDGEALAKLDGEFHALRAVLLIDLSVEHVLNMIILDNDGPDQSGDARADKNFRQLIQAAGKIYKTKTGNRRFPQEKNLKIVHDLRNLAQHNGTAPRNPELFRYIPRIRQFHQGVFEDLFGVDFDTLQIWDFLPNPDVGRFMRECSELAQGDQIDRNAAALGCWAIYYRITLILRREGYLRGGRWSENSALKKVHKLRPGIAGSRLRDSRGSVHNLAHSVNELREALEKELNAIRAELLVASLGIPLAETRRFIQTLRVAFWSLPASTVFTAAMLETRHSRGVQEDELPPMLAYIARLAYLSAESFPSHFASLRVNISPKEKVAAYRASRSVDSQS